MTNEPKYCFIDKKSEKEKTVKRFSKFFYRNDLDEKAIGELSKKISEHAIMAAAIVNNETVGFAAYYRNDAATKTAYISVVVIDPEYRGMGLGTEIIKNVIDDCDKNGYERIRLEVDKNNQKAIRLYQKFGFKKVEEKSENNCYYELTVK